MRGVIQNRAARQQLQDMRRLRFEKITPTDIDGFSEYRGADFWFHELKYGSAPLRGGQRLAYERLVDAITRAGSVVLFCVASHSTEIGKDIDTGMALVVEYRWMFRWHTPMKPTPLKDAWEIWVGLCQNHSRMHLRRSRRAIA